MNYVSIGAPVDWNSIHPNKEADGGAAGLPVLWFCFYFFFIVVLDYDPKIKHDVMGLETNSYLSVVWFLCSNRESFLINGKNDWFSNWSKHLLFLKNLGGAFGVVQSSGIRWSKCHSIASNGTLAKPGAQRIDCQSRFAHFCASSCCCIGTDWIRRASVSNSIEFSSAAQWPWATSHAPTACHTFTQIHQIWVSSPSIYGPATTHEVFTKLM